MISTLLALLRLFPFLCGGHRQLALENLALRQQLTVYRIAVALAPWRPALLGRAVQAVERLEAGVDHRRP